jgi:hypothetical protein
LTRIDGGCSTRSTLGQPQAAAARELIREALAGREAQARPRRLASDYAAERDDAKGRLEDLEAGQLELLTGRAQPHTSSLNSSPTSYEE